MNPARIFLFTKKHGNLGFTLVEFLIVFVISAIIIAFAIPAFNSFNRGQALKNAASELKTYLRSAQNKALAGEKPCDFPQTQTLMGWYIRLDSSLSYTIASRCVNDTTGLDVGTDFLGRSYTARNISSISMTPNPPGPENVDYIMFQPVTKGVVFYHDSFLDANKMSLTSVTFTLTGIDGKQYLVVVYPSGEIIDVKMP